MKKISRFRIIALLAIPLMGCGRYEKSFSIVKKSDYGSNKCWINDAGEISAFLVVSKSNDKSIPYIVSKNCIVGESGVLDGVSIIDNLNEISIVDREREISRVLKNRSFITEAITEHPLPESKSKIYYFLSEFKEVSTYKGIRVISPTHVKYIEEVNMDFEKFLGLDRGSRKELALQYYHR